MLLAGSLGQIGKALGAADVHKTCSQGNRPTGQLQIACVEVLHHRLKIREEGTCTWVATGFRTETRHHSTRCTGPTELQSGPTGSTSPWSRSSRRSASQTHRTGPCPACCPQGTDSAGSSDTADLRSG